VSANGVPYAALAPRLIPSIPISYFYAYGDDFATWTLDATLVIAITFLGSATQARRQPLHGSRRGIRTWLVRSEKVPEFLPDS
jgi:hypothetical protein